ncbi:MAG: type II toxin-antitoxin system VapC family toxin [Acidobacteriota bacterium]|nr:type II toxin-antitoxin system VapC family toxin [Acidobacteriota bacterium]
MILYLDTSSLVKLYVEEDGSSAVRGLVESASTVATSVIAYPEARGAFARRCREGSLTRAEHDRVKSDFDLDWPHLLRMDVNGTIARHAGELAERHSLRGLDSLHLACYLALCSRVPDGSVELSCFDETLGIAAVAARE